MQNLKNQGLVYTEYKYKKVLKRACWLAYLEQYYQREWSQYQVDLMISIISADYLINKLSRVLLPEAKYFLLFYKTNESNRYQYEYVNGLPLFHREIYIDTRNSIHPNEYLVPLYCVLSSKVTKLYKINPCHDYSYIRVIILKIGEIDPKYQSIEAKRKYHFYHQFLKENKYMHCFDDSLKLYNIPKLNYDQESLIKGKRVRSIL